MSSAVSIVIDIYTTGSIRCVSTVCTDTLPRFVATAASSCSHSLIIVACYDRALIEPKRAGELAESWCVLTRKSFKALTACQ